MEEKEKKKRNWENSKYKKFVRISAEAHEKLKKICGKKSLAGKADEIIKEF